MFEPDDMNMKETAMNLKPAPPVGHQWSPAEQAWLEQQAEVAEKPEGLEPSCEKESEGFSRHATPSPEHIESRVPR